MFPKVAIFTGAAVLGVLLGGVLGGFGGVRGARTATHGGGAAGRGAWRARMVISGKRSAARAIFRVEPEEHRRAPSSPLAVAQALR